MPFSEKSLASITLIFFIKVSSRLRLFGSAFKETLSSAFSKSNPWPQPKFLPNRPWETGLGFLVDLPRRPSSRIARSAEVRPTNSGCQPHLNYSDPDHRGALRKRPE